MPLDKLVLITVCVIIVCVIITCMATLSILFFVLTAVNVPFGFLGLIPAALAGYVVYRVIAQRVGNKVEDHYDGMEN